MLSLLKSSARQDFEDEIIIVIIGIIRKTKKITEMQWQLFEILQYIQQKQEGRLNHLLKLVNLYILYAKSYFQDHPDKLGTLVIMASQALVSKKGEQIRESCNSEGALLLQLLLHSLQTCV